MSIPVNQLLLGDCLEVLRTLPDSSVDAVVTDPPAGIEFMGKDWDNPEKFGSTFTAHGYSDGGDRVAAPTQKLSLRNPNCRKCRKHIRGKDGCRCEVPDSDEDVSFVQLQRTRQRDGFVQFLTKVMQECYRVLKPGGHAIVWSLPRTSHWTATAIENVGFEVRDALHHAKDRTPDVVEFLASLTPEQLELLMRAEESSNVMAHLFGCLSEDTDILTENGWEPYQTLVEGRQVLCYDAGHDIFTWQPIQQVYVYPYDDTAYRLYGNRTDQLVSRNHRCLVERGGKTIFEYAEALQPQENVPVLEDLHGLLQAVSLPDQGSIGAQEKLLACLQDSSAERSQEGASERNRPSRQSQPNGQSARESGAVCDQQGPQAVRGAPYTSTDLVRVEPVHLIGKVWCVRVPTGAFVARRNGKVFVTGNSGFPKSLNISKSLDKMAGAVRKVVKEGKGFDPDRHVVNQFNSISPSNVGVNTAAFKARIGEVTEPATEEAKKWDGWGTALKPAVEIWWLVRKPVEAKNTSSQVLATGTGL